MRQKNNNNKNTLTLCSCVRVLWGISTVFIYTYCIEGSYNATEQKLQSTLLLL